MSRVQPPTLRDVAEAAGVHAATAKVAESLGCRPNPIARGLTTAKPATVGIEHDNDAGRERAHVESLRSRQVDGLIVGALLDQRLVAGWGSLWANERCFLRGHSPWTPSSTSTSTSRQWSGSGPSAAPLTTHPRTRPGRCRTTPSRGVPGGAPPASPNPPPDRLGHVRALLLENLHPLASTILTGAGVEVETRRDALDEDELVDALSGVDLLGIRSKTEVTERVLRARPDLLAVGAFCIGTNQIDLATASALGVAAFNAPYSNTRSVVELAIADLIAMARQLTVRDKALHEGVWDKSSDGSHEVRGRTLGIVGYGNIGSQLSVVAEMLGMSVYFYDTEDKLALGNARRCSSLEELLDTVETVTLHVDGRAGNAGIFGAEQFARMRPRSLFLNLSRGFVVDYDALAGAVTSGQLAGAAVDVFPSEPKSRGDHFDSPLRGLPNVILTPHVGGSTEEAQEDIGRFVGGKLRDYVQLGTTTLSVNLPRLSPERSRHAQRIAHLHHNTPGVLARLNQVLADHDVNIHGQVLSTSGDVGYVVTDTDSPLPAEVLAALREIHDTVRLRLID